MTTTEQTLIKNGPNKPSLNNLHRLHMHTRCISSHYPAFASSWFPPDKTRLLLVICRSKDSFLYRFYLRRNHISLAFRTRLIAMVFYYRGNLNANFNCPFFTGMTLLAQHGDMNGDVFFLPPALPLTLTLEQGLLVMLSYWRRIKALN